MNGWQPIETAPKDGTRVLIFVPGDASWFEDSSGKTWPIHYVGVHAARFEPEMGRPETKIHRGVLPALNGMWVAGGGLWADEDLAFAYAQPTHWMPLPEPPTGSP